MRLSLRLIFSLVLGVTLLLFLFAVFQVKAEKRGLQKELENRAAIVGENLEGKVEPLISPRSHKRLREVVKEQLSEAIRFALVMDPAERSARMHRMRQIVKNFNIYRWAADLTTDLCEIRLETRVEVG
jgi:uncharacterized protein (DUF58 family)